MPIRCACEQRRLASVEIDPRPMHGGQQFIANPVERAKNRSKSKVRAKVEHSIGVIKHVFGFAKVRYRGLKKNEHRLIVTCALANLFIVRRIVRRQLLRLGEA
jgi:IS5 family transposase